MVLQSKIDQFINRAQTKITELAQETAEDLYESFADNEDIKLANELSDVIVSLQDDLLDWTDYEIELAIDYYNYKAELNDYALVNYANIETIISEDSTSSTDNSWVDPFNELNATVSSNYTYFEGEVSRLDTKIDNIDLSGLIPQTLIDDVDANSLARHSHTNKTILDSVTQAHLDAIGLNTTHRNNTGIHVTSVEKADWNSRVTTTQLNAGLDLKAPLVHTHAIADIDGLQDYLLTLEPEKGDKGDPGITPTLTPGTALDGETFTIDIDNTDPAFPVLNMTIPVPTDGEDLHIDEFGNASGRLSDTYNTYAEGYAYFGTDTGYLYFRKPFDSVGNPVPATTTSGWHSVKFAGSNGWSPIIGAKIISDTKTVLIIKGWTGGTGTMPELGTNPDNPVYIGLDGFTYYVSQAINVKGTQGISGPAGKIMFPDTTDLLSNRYLYDNSPRDTIFLDSEQGIIYRKLSDTLADWSVGYQWKGDKGDQGEPGPAGDASLINYPYIDFQANDTIPEYKKGRLYFDKAEDALTYYNEKTGISNQMGRELWIRVKNENAYIIPNGTVIYMSGASVTVLTCDLADANEYNESRVIGIATMDIPANGGIGYATVFGKVGRLDTSLWTDGSIIYLDEDNPGKFCTTYPISGGAFKVRLGIISNQSATEGAIEVSISANEYSIEVTTERGFPNKQDVSISWDNITRTLSLQPVIDKYRYYFKGEKYTKTGIDSIQIPDVEGSYLFYFNAETLTYIHNATKLEILGIIENYANVVYLYWDATNKINVFTGVELHWSKGYGVRNHTKDHSTIGAIYDSGFTQTEGALGGDGSLAEHAKFGSGPGVIYDEDIRHNITGFLSTNGVNKVYYSDTAGNPRFSKLANFSVLTTGTGRLAYNPTGSGLLECGDNTFVWCHLYASGALNPDEGMSTFVGKGNYSSTADAYAALSDEIVEINQTSLPSPEFVPIASRLFQTRNIYGNTVNAKIVAADTEGSAFVDWRVSRATGGQGVSSASAGDIIPIFSDDQLKIVDNNDTTKAAVFQNENISPSTTRTFTFPNKNGTFAMLADVSKYTESATQPIAPKTGDRWLNTANGKEYIYFANETWVNF